MSEDSERLNPEGKPVRERRLHESVERFLTHNFKWLLLIAVVAIGAGWYFGVEVPREPPRWLRVVFWTALLGSPLAYVLAARVVEMLSDRWGIILLDLDARDNEVAIWNIPRKRWQEIAVTDGDLFRLDASRTVYAGKNFDPDELTIEGTWRGSMSDVELLRTQEKIDELRTQLEDFGKEGLTVYIRRSSIVRDAVLDISLSVLRTLERGVVPDGEKVQEATDRALSKYDFDKKLDETADPDAGESPDPDSEKDPLEERIDADDLRGNADAD